MLGTMWMLLITQGQAMEPQARGLVVGAATLGGELAGALGGGLIGVGVGSAICSQTSSFECWAPLLGGGFGATVGTIGGGLGGAAWGAKIVDVRGSRTVAWTAAPLAAGVVLIVTGTVTEASALQTGGVIVAVAGMPIAAGLAAASDDQHHGGATLSLSVNPNPQRPGLQLSGTF